MESRNKNIFLNSVAKRLGRSKVRLGTEKPEWSVSPQNEVSSNLLQRDLMEVFRNQCDKIHTKLRETHRYELSTALKEAIEEYNGKKIVVSNDIRNTEYKLDEFYHEIEKEGKVVCYWDKSDKKNNLSFAEEADVGITFSDITLAESGTVILFNNKNNGRSLSLLPKTYISIIPKHTIVPRMTQAVREIRESYIKERKIPTCISFITGPSNSADIEMNLIVGVHGPIHVTYIVVEN